MGTENSFKKFVFIIFSGIRFDQLFVQLPTGWFPFGLKLML